MKTYDEAARMFTAQTPADLHRLAAETQGKYRELVDEVTANDHTISALASLCEECIKMNLSKEATVTTIALSAYMRGFLIGVEMAKPDMPEVRTPPPILQRRTGMFCDCTAPAGFQICDTCGGTITR